MNRILAVEIGKNLPMGSGRNIDSTFPSLSSLVSVLLKNSLTIVGTLLLILLIFGGVMFIIGAGSGDSKKQAMARTAITDAVIGFVIAMFAYAIVEIVQVITGVNILNSGL